MRNRFLPYFLAVLALTWNSACIFSPKEDDPDPPAPIPINDTPENLIKRFMATYEQKMGTEYEALFTNDYIFEFSNATDPLLVTEYSSGWFREDERISAQNLFQGFTDEASNYHPPATSIDINLSPTNPQPDNGVGLDPTTHYQLLATVDATIVIPPEANQTEPTTYLIDNNIHRFFLVRGDAAVDLDPAQKADSTRWYIYRWRDETVSISTATGRLSPASYSAPRGTTTTWGRMKDSTR